ncbi:uncharacterized protein EI90DRAFT_3075077 [Cantharellus anzutake]|uniref:uncharacterized protein n=1 Tax=Cantharellus anzutake TaxID=1750568 RepID=UPI001907AA9C|nr:uncharacterized protein EI90DRAFT_3075077 [Cantharellus anzutake]KAF8324561.1 hypothetical protein EI90DRAFT_3075077 [Cantharellus anzutake]
MSLRAAGLFATIPFKVLAVHHFPIELADPRSRDAFTISNWPSLRGDCAARISLCKYRFRAFRDIVPDSSSDIP